MSESIEKKAAAALNCGNEELNATEAAQTQNQEQQEKPARQGTRRAGDNFLDVIYKFETSYPGGLTADTLFDESVFQRDVRTALDAYVLEGAKLAKRKDSCSYEMWTEALIMLGNIANARYEAAEIDDATREMMLLVIEAQEQLWADMRVNA